jgi:hypothetical protein
MGCGECGDVDRDRAPVMTHEMGALYLQRIEKLDEIGCKGHRIIAVVRGQAGGRIASQHRSDDPVASLHQMVGGGRPAVGGVWEPVDADNGGSSPGLEGHELHGAECHWVLIHEGHPRIKAD